MRTINAKFWEFINNSFVKITLRPGQKLAWSKYGRTEEGWESEAREWEYDLADNIVLESITCDGCDCDGRLTNYWDGFCYVNELQWQPAAKFIDGPDMYYDYSIMLPNWEKLSASQRDRYAEAMGY